MQETTRVLDLLISDLDILITMTRDEIALVKEAKHAEVGARQREKERVLRRFESNKERLNTLLQTLMQERPDATLEEMLDAEQQSRFAAFRQKLTELHEENRNYARIVAVLGEFFNSLVSAILPMKEEGYRREQPRPAAFLKVRV